MTSRLDPFNVWGATFGVVRTVAGSLAHAVTGVVGSVLGGVLDTHPATITAPPPSVDTTGDPGPTDRAAGRTASGLDAKMNALLTRAIEQSTTSGREELFHRILDLLVPDEARIISALSDGDSSPMVSVHALTRAGLLGEALIENAALVGRTANVALPRLTPTYVGHLLALGLLETGPEDASLKDEYQILLADSDVLRAIREGSRGPVPARVQRRTIRLSALGRELWAATVGAPE